MPKRYSQDLRDRVLAAYDRGMKTRLIATVFDVSPAWARRVKQRRDQFGEVTPRASGGLRCIKVDRAQLVALLQAHPDATLEELRARLGVRCALWTICVALRKLGFTFKKKSCARRSRTDRMWSSAAPSGSNSPARSMAGV